MININFDTKEKRPLKLLCLGAHCDDLEIGCGGTILKLAENNPGLSVTWVVFSSNEIRKKEAQDAADLFLQKVENKKIIIEEFKDGFFPYNGAEIKNYFESLKKNENPDLILTHYRNDLHQDHRLISDLTWNTFRNHLILEYEIPKYDGDLGQPNFFVELPQNIVQQKIDNLMKAYKSQIEKHWFTEETFKAIMRLRGMESNALDKMAESFYCRKVKF